MGQIQDPALFDTTRLPTTMNTTIFWRTVWKEYRQQRTLWFTMLLLSLLMQVMYLAGQWLEGSLAYAPPQEHATALFSIALCSPVLYILGCSAILFAGERENETFAFQQALPISSGQYFAGKAAFALLSVLALMPAGWLIAWVLARGALPTADYQATLWLVCGLTCVEVFVWGALFSLLMGRVLPAAGVAGTAAALATAGVLTLVGGLHPLGQNEFLVTVPFRAAVAALVGAVVLYLGRRSLHDHLFQPRRAGARVRANMVSYAPTSWRARIRACGRLLWQELRQSWVTLATALFIGLLVFLSAPLRPLEGRPSHPLLLLAPGFVAALFGGCTLYGDKQASRFRYFAERGVRPRWVWATRLLLWGLGLVLVLGVLVLRFGSLPAPAEPNAEAFLWTALLAFSAGQAGAMFTRSGILGIVVGITAALLGVFWTVAALACEIPWWIAVAPLVVILLFSTWLYAPDWIAERTSRWVRARTCAALVIPIIGWWLAVSFYRGHEVPAVTLPLDATEVTRGDTPDARETGRMYREAFGLLASPRASDSDSASEPPSADVQRGLELFRAAAARPSCRLTERLSFQAGFDVRQLAHLVLEEARRLDEADAWDGALELRFDVLQFAGHLYQQPWPFLQLQGVALEQMVGKSLAEWAWQSGQDATRVREALKRWEQWQQTTRPRFELGIAGERELRIEVVRLSPAAWREYVGDSPGLYSSMRMLSWLLPWEQQRALRVIDVAAAEEIAASRQAESLLWLNDQTSIAGEESLQRDGLSLLSERARKWHRTTPMAKFLLSPAFRGALAEATLLRRAGRLRLALIAWRLEHGELPQGFDELIGHGLDAVPLDPFTGRPFFYDREGLPIYEPVPFSSEMGSTMGPMPGTAGGPGIIVEPKIIGREPPFLWSPGHLVEFRPTSGTATDMPPVSEFWSNGQQLSAHVVRDVGVLFPLAPRELGP